MRSTILHLLLTLVILFIKLCNFVAQASENFCYNNSVDAVLWNGKMYKLTRGDLVVNFDHSSRYGSVGQFRQLDILHQTFGKSEAEVHYQSMFYIHDINIDHCHLNFSKECFAMRSLRYSVIAFTYDNFGNQYLNQTYHYNTHYTRHYSIPIWQDLCDHTYADTNDTQLFPKYIGCKSKNIAHKPATYSIDKHLLVFIFNALSINKTKAVLATRTLTYDHWRDGWKYTDIENSENLLYLTAFYWHFTKKVYVVVENVSESSGGFIYQFNEMDLKNPLIPTNQRVIDFFGCDGSVLGFRKRPVMLTTKSVTDATQTDTAGIIAVTILLALIFIGIIVLIGILILIFLNYKRKKTDAANQSFDKHRSQTNMLNATEVKEDRSQTNNSNAIEETNNVSTQTDAEVSATKTNVENDNKPD